MCTVDVDAAVRVLAACTNVVAAWVFGSASGGRVRPGGDVDVAVLFRRPPSLDELADLRADLQEALGFEEIDLVPLTDESPAALRFEALSGRRVFCRDVGRVAEFQSLASREYEDDMAFAARGLRAWAEARRQRQGPKSGGR
ncbi:type VII toxin-antitoxin system MntA family adenylyltransferase antitoxin [Deferrisoma camini]|uniref:type VII toxin-antitoxin system MntA family adenylyltransferase antitoxin n=1 Tax=Deferrisoma camini TaxID=1035120 RepID=UPI00046D438A|nr:nucleotidyltransferase domain-containing protein [Deferrisoma camini]